jgi:hypothetical protein
VRRSYHPQSNTVTVLIYYVKNFVQGASLLWASSHPTSSDSSNYSRFSADIIHAGVSCLTGTSSRSSELSDHLVQGVQGTSAPHLVLLQPVCPSSMFPVSPLRLIAHLSCHGGEPQIQSCSCGCESWQRLPPASLVPSDPT